jgi:hypothetical protein
MIDATSCLTRTGTEDEPRQNREKAVGCRELRSWSAFSPDGYPFLVGGLEKRVWMLLQASETRVSIGRG